MSQENVELVRSQYELFARRDFQGMLEYVDPGVEITEPPEIPGAARQADWSSMRCERGGRTSSTSATAR